MQHLPRQLSDLATESLSEVKPGKAQGGRREKALTRAAFPRYHRVRAHTTPTEGRLPGVSEARRQMVLVRALPSSSPAVCEGGGEGAAGGRRMPWGAGRFKSEVTGRTARGGAARKLCLALNIRVVMFQW